jgi:hypothetical protein
MRRTRKRVTKRGGKSLITTLKKIKKYTADRYVPDLTIGRRLNSVASSIAHSDNIIAKSLTKVGNTTKFLANLDVTRQGIAAFKSFVNAGDVDRILIKNQQFLSLIEPQQVKSMYMKEHDYEVEIYEVKDTMFFNGTYIYRKEYLESYLRDKKKKYDKIVGGDDDDDVFEGGKTEEPNPTESGDGSNPTEPGDGSVNGSNTDGSKKPGENPNTEAAKNKAADAKVDENNKKEDMDMGDRSFLECGSMPNWSESASLAILNDYRILDPDHELLERNDYKTNSIAYISFHRDFATLYRLLLNYKHQYNRSLWNVSEQITMRHIKHTLRVNYAFIKRNYSIKQDFKETSKEFLEFLRMFGASFTKMFTSGEINKTDAKRKDENNADIMIDATNPEPIDDKKAKQEPGEGEPGEGETGEGETGEGGGRISNIISNSVNAVTKGVNTGYKKWMERRIGTKLYKYYNYNFEKYFTTVTSTKAIKNFGRTMAGIGGSEYIKPHYMDVEVAFAVLIAISILKEYGLYGLAKDKYKKILELDLTTYEIKYKKEVTDDGTTKYKGIKGNYTVQELDDNVKQDLKVQRDDWKRFFSTGTDYEDANFVDHRSAKTDSYYLLEDDANKELYELLRSKAHKVKQTKDGKVKDGQDGQNIDGQDGQVKDGQDRQNKDGQNKDGKVKVGQVNVLAWIQEFCELYKEKKSVEELKIKELKEQEKNKQKGGQDNGEEQEGGGDDIGDGTLYRFLNVVFDKCFRFMNQRFVWDLEKQYLSDKDKKQNNGKTVERNICDFMNYVNKTKYDATNVFSNTLLFNIIGTFTPGGVAMTPHLNTSTRTFALYIGSLLNMLTKEEIIDLRNLFKDVYVCNLMDNPLNLAEVKDMYEKEGKRDVYIPLMGSSAVVEIRKFEELGSKCKIHFVAQDMKRSSENPDAKAITGGKGDGEGDDKTGGLKGVVSEFENPLNRQTGESEAKPPQTGESEDVKPGDEAKTEVITSDAKTEVKTDVTMEPSIKLSDVNIGNIVINDEPPSESKDPPSSTPPESKDPPSSTPSDSKVPSPTPSDSKDTSSTPPESKEPTIDKEKCIKRKTYVLNDKNKKFRIAYKIKKTYASIKFNEDGSIKDEATGKIWSQADISKGLPFGINGIYFGTLIGINRKNISALGKVAETMNRSAREKAKANIANAFVYTGNKTLETANDAFDKTVETVKYTGDKIQETEKYIQNKIKDAPNAVINKLKDAHNAADNKMKQFSESALNMQNKANQGIEDFGKSVEAPIRNLFASNAEDNQMKQFSESAINMENKANQYIANFGKRLEEPFNLLTKRRVGVRKNKKTRRGGGLMNMPFEKHDNIVFKVKVFGMLVATKDTEITYMMEKIGTKDEVAGTGTDPKKKTWFEIYEIDPPRSQILPSAVAPGTLNTEGTSTTVVPPKTEGTPSDVTSSSEKEPNNTLEERIPVETLKNVLGKSPTASLNKALDPLQNVKDIVSDSTGTDPISGTPKTADYPDNNNVGLVKKAEESPPNNSFSICTIS